MNIIHLIILYPINRIGWIIGYLARSFIFGYYSGFYSIELKERDKIIGELQEEIDKMEA